MATVRSVYSQCSSTTGSGCKKCPVRGRPLDPFPGSMGNAPLALCNPTTDKTCKVVKLTIDTHAKCALQSRSAAPLVHAAQNAALRCINASRPQCNKGALQRCQTNYSYSTRQLLHSRGQTFEQKSVTANDCYTLQAKPRGDKVCCQAITASCLACQAGISVALYCRMNHGAPGCPADQQLCDVCKVQSQNVRRENNTVFAKNNAVDTGLYISAMALGQNVQAELDDYGSHDMKVRLPSEVDVLGLDRVKPSIL